MVAAAIIGGAVVAGAGAAYAGSEAAGATRSAANQATNAQLTAQDKAIAQAAPYTSLGQAAIPTYENLLGIGSGGTVDPKLAQSTLENLPGYQFTKNQGVENTQRAASASGLNLSGNQLAAVTQFSTGLADQTYQTELSNLLAPVQIGQAAASGNAAIIGQTGTNLANIAIGQGNNTAAIDANTIAGLTRAGSNATDQYLTYKTLQSLNPGQGNAPTYTPDSSNINTGYPAPSFGQGG